MRGREKFSVLHACGAKNGNDRSGEGVVAQQDAGQPLDTFLAGRGTTFTGTGGGSGGSVS